MLSCSADGMLISPVRESIPSALQDNVMNIPSALQDSSHSSSSPLKRKIQQIPSLHVSKDTLVS
jgi:hypothetical protein